MCVGNSNDVVVIETTTPPLFRDANHRRKGYNDMRYGLRLPVLQPQGQSHRRGAKITLLTRAMGSWRPSHNSLYLSVRLKICVRKRKTT